MASGPITSWQIDGETTETVTELSLLGSKITADGWWLQPWNEKTLAPWKKNFDQPGQHIKKQRHYFANNCLSSQSCGFPSSHAWMWELDHKESWVLKNWCFWTVVLEKTLESPLDCREIHPVHAKVISSVLNMHWNDWCWSWNCNTLATSCEELTYWKGPWCWEGLGAGGEGDDRGWDGWMTSPPQWTWVWVNSWVGDRQGGLVCCSPWGRKESDMTEWLNWLCHKEQTWPHIEYVPLALTFMLHCLCLVTQALHLW